MAKDLGLAILFDIYAPMLTDKQRDTLDLYYNEDLSLGEIAETTGTTRQAVMNNIRKSELHLRELEEKLGLADRSAKAEKLLTQLENMLSGDENADRSGVQRLINEIRELL